MASNPSTTACPDGVWTKVADSVESCILHKINFAPNHYLHTYRVEDDPAPTNDNDAAPWDANSLIVNSDGAIDVYIKAVGAAGEVRLDV